MRYVSIFSGVDAATLAWEPLGWEPIAFCEIDDFPSAVLAERWPNVPNLGDITKVDWKNEINGAVDLVVGGSPCQSFSIAGKREGLKGASGLMFEYIRCVQELRPRWFLWENVPGALTSENGGAFGQLLSEMDELGYSLAWRILDAQFFGVAQRRRRLFLVGHLGAESPAEVLFEQDCLSWNPKSSREKRKELARRAGRSTSCAGFKHSAAPRASVGKNILCMTGTQAHCHISDEIAGCLTAHMGKDDAPVVVGDSNSENAANKAFGLAQNTRNEVRIVGDGTISGSITANQGMKQTTFACTGGTYPIAMGDLNAHTAICRNVCPTLKCGGDGAMVASEIGDKHTGLSPILVRRLTPLECERLQGFPDGHTLIAWKGKPAEECPDGPRYKAIGNSMAVPVMRWLGERIEAADRI